MDRRKGKVRDRSQQLSTISAGVVQERGLDERKGHGWGEWVEITGCGQVEDQVKVQRSELF